MGATLPGLPNAVLGRTAKVARGFTNTGPDVQDLVAADALGRALDRLSSQYGNDPADWRWGTAHIARSIHKPLGNLPALARAFDITVPTGGDPWTVNVGQYWANEAQPFHNRHAASMRTVFDLANLENWFFIYQTGQSGLVLPGP